MLSLGTRPLPKAEGSRVGGFSACFSIWLASSLSLPSTVARSALSLYRGVSGVLGGELASDGDGDLEGGIVVASRGICGIERRGCFIGIPYSGMEKAKPRDEQTM